MFSFFGKYKKQSFNIFVGFFLLFSVFSSMFPERVYAMPVEDGPAIVQREALAHRQDLKATVMQKILMGVLSATIQSISYYAQEFAYRSAVWVASSDKGRKSLVEKESWGDFFKNTALNAAAMAIQDFGKTWGFDICRFPDVNLQLYLEIGLRQMDRPTIDCTWQDLKNTYGQYKDLAKDTADFMKGEDPAAVDRAIARKFTDSLRVNNTDFGVAAGAIVQVDKMVVEKEKAAYAERTTNKGFKDLSSIISGNVQTPGEVIGEETKKELSRKDKQNFEYSQIGSIYASGAYEIIPSTVAMFINTLINTYAGRILPFNNDESTYTDPEIVYNSDSSGSSYAFDQLEAAKTAFSFLRAVAPQAQVNDYDTFLSELAMCPDQPGTNNCVMDSGLQSVLSLQDHLTIRQALEKGYLHGDWKLISPRRPSEHESITGCLTDKYCYSNIQKMRKARLLPLGFEVAALRSDPDHPWTLKDVVDGFDKCDYTVPGVATSTVANPAFPFCHLINPNWILQLPKYRCDAMVYSDNLEFEGSDTRQYECADLSSCISFNADGSCAGWGYCTKEKNTWEIKVDKCEPQYNTCTTFINTENKQITSYLAKTVDYGKCTADNTGCRAYSLGAVVDPLGVTTTWKTSVETVTDAKQYGNTQTAYFNAKIKNLSTVCNANNDGCSAFWQADLLDTGLYVDRISASTGTDYAMTNSLTYLKKAPDYLSCYDRDLATPQIEWPRTLPEANEVVARNSSCNNFASACLREEVGCEAFTPADGGATLPGKIGATNFCDAQCVGYETFKQEASEFDPAKFPMYFIASQADICSAEAVGCTEFTNMDALSRGGEAIEYYSHLEYCEKPNNNVDKPNVRAFYSWEGSANTGYNIITHKLKPLTRSDAETISRENPGIVGFIEGAPAYVLTTPEALLTYTSKCNEAAYNTMLSDGPDAVGAASTNCKALFDDAGNTYYRLTDYTVVIDETCHPLRKTELVFEPETRLGYNNQAACEGIHDRWNTSVAGAPFCERCINGGKFEGGFCVYQTISRPDVSTSCTKEENGCRAYTGNAVGNIEDVITLEDFEPFAETDADYTQALGSWRSANSASPKLRIVKEATHNEKHSLQVDPGVTLVRDMATSTVQKDMWYELSFVAKSIAGGQPLKIEIKQGNDVFATFASVAKPAKIESAWNVYKFGPIQFTGNSDIPTTLVFDRAAGNTAYFIDQVRLRKISKMQNYIKDSWKNKNAGLEVPMVCDSLPEDHLPGEALGCESYKDSNDINRYAVGFERLCREKAIGCEPLWDTYNTIEGEGSERAQAFNVLCFGDENATCKIIHDEQELANCFVPRGESFCYVPKVVIPPGLTWSTFQTAMTASNNGVRKVDLDASSIVTLADTPEASPIFLASGEKQKYACAKGAVSCQKSGLEAKYLPSNATTSFQFSEFFVKNDPDKYTETICRNDLVGCTKYSDAGKETYFKDPVVTGGSLCKWKNPGENENRTYGWFLDNIGQCQNNVDTLCKADSDCGDGDTCLKVDVACAPDHMVGDGMYDIWSNETPLRYQGNVGICPAAANQCREIVDRQDTSHINPDGKPYYLIFNEKVAKKRDGTECPGNQVSLTEGCVLFDKTDEPNKLYDSAASYKRSEKKPDNPYGLVPPVTANDPASSGFRVSDSNLVLKVDRSRECSEWLGCESQALIKDASGGYSYVCEKVGACEKIGSVNGECGKNVDPLASPEDNNLAMNRLTNDQYVTRNVSWFDEEFSGYSLYNHFQIGNYMYIYFKFPKIFDNFIKQSPVVDHSYIARVVSGSLFRGNRGLDKDCYADDDSQTDWSICGFDDGGRCYNNNCMYPIDGVFKPEERVDPAYIAVQDDLSNQGEDVPDEMWNQISKIIARLETDTCKSAPEKDSPFSSDISVIKKSFLAENGIVMRNYSVDRKPGFENTNFCQEGECTCSYKKISYKSGVKDYWPTEVKMYSNPDNICEGGPRQGMPCTLNPNTCNDENTTYECVPVTKQDIFIGYTGFCLEYDLGRPNKYNQQYPCLTWLPVQGSVSPFDLYNAEVNAGYNPDTDAKENTDDALFGGVAYCTEATIEKNPKNDNILHNYAMIYNRKAAIRELDASFLVGEATYDENKIPPDAEEACETRVLGVLENTEIGNFGRGSLSSPLTKYQEIFCQPGVPSQSAISPTYPNRDTVTYLTSWVTKKTGDDSAQLLRTESGLSPEILNDFANITDLDGLYSSFFGAADDKTDCGNGADKVPCIPYGFAPASLPDIGGVYNTLGPIIHPPRTFGFSLENRFIGQCFESLTTPTTTGYLELCLNPIQPYATSLNKEWSYPEGANHHNYAPAGMCGTTRQTDPIPAAAVAIWAPPADAVIDRATITERFVRDFTNQKMIDCMSEGHEETWCIYQYSHGGFGIPSILQTCQNDNYGNQLIGFGDDGRPYVPMGLCGRAMQSNSNDALLSENYTDLWVAILQAVGRVIPTAQDIWNRAYGLMDDCLSTQQAEVFGDLFSYQSQLSDRRVSSVFFSPEAKTLLSNFQTGEFGRAYDTMVNQSILPSTYEENLNLYQLKRVYFMPTGYPYGPEDSVPQLMDTESMYIDFALADEASVKGTGVIEKSVPATAADIQNTLNERFFAQATTNGYVYTGMTPFSDDDVAINLSDDHVSSSLVNIVNLPENSALKERNKVSKRYYLIYSPNDGVVRDDGNGVKIPAQDFFGGSACNEDQTYFAVGMDFNLNGEFLGYVSNWCAGKGDKKYGIQFAVVATYNNMCTEIKKVYDTKRAGFTSFMRKDSNKAWTNRVWRFANSVAPKLTGYTGFSKDMTEMPFGSLNFSDGQLSITNNSYLQKFVYGFRNLEWSEVGDPQGGAGVPFSCVHGDCSNLSKPTNGTLRYGANIVNTLHDKTKANAHSLLHQLFAKEYMKVEIGVGGRVQCFDRFVRDYNFSSFALAMCPGNDDVARNAILDREFDGGDGTHYGITCDGVITAEEARLGPQFMACLESPNSIDETSEDFSNARTTLNQSGESVKLLPPQIYSIQPYTCLVEKGKVCPPWEKDSFTIGNYNGSLGDYDGDHRNDEDKDGNGNPDPLVIFGNMYYARMRFFAFADDNRMPIRSIKLDWNDGTLDQLDKRGLYKNRKPVCELDDGYGAPAADAAHLSMCVTNGGNIPTGMPCLNTEDVIAGQVAVACPLGQTCKSLADINNGSLGTEYVDTKQFGNLARACEPHYFEYSHQYTCSSDEVDEVRRTGGDGGEGPIMRIDNPLLGNVTNFLRMYPGVDYVCAFKPKVQVEDNWGWCNGSCTKVYNNQGNPIGGDTPAEQVGCYNAWPAPTARDPNNTYNQCEIPVPDKINPWTEYKQYIIMVPSRE